MVETIITLLIYIAVVVGVCYLVIQVFWGIVVLVVFLLLYRALAHGGKLSLR